MPRFAKKGSTKINILEQMFKEIQNSNENWASVDGKEIKSMKSFNEINPTKYDELVEKYLEAITSNLENSATYKDVHKIDFDFENCGATGTFYDKNISQHSQLIDGTEIIWAYGGGDWEMPVQFVLYLDPNDKVRAYVPSNGNVYCHKCKCALGTCECEDQPEEYDDDYYPNHLDFDQMMVDVNNRIQTK